MKKYKLESASGSLQTGYFCESYIEKIVDLGFEIKVKKPLNENLMYFICIENLDELEKITELCSNGIIITNRSEDEKYSIIKFYDDYIE